MKYNLSDPDLIQAKIQEKRLKLGIVVKSHKFLPGFFKRKEIELVDGELFRIIDGIPTPYVP